MGHKIVKSYSSKGSGVSGITIQNKYGRFTGHAFFNEDDDIDTFSHFAGERYAEIRAGAEFAKFRYKQEKIKLKTIQDLKKDILRNTKEVSPEIMRRINLKLRDYSQSMEAYKNLHEYLLSSVDKQVEEREKILARRDRSKEIK